MTGSILSVHVIDARDLRTRTGEKANAQIRLKIEKQSSKTKVVYNSNDPVWNEVIAFDIATGTDDLVLTVENVDGNDKEIIGEH
jgi:Ca2+-dependent lipid-binding protein